MLNIYEIVIGLEVHVELDTQSKMFCPCANRFGATPNTNVCPVCLGLPGSLPVLNEHTLVLALQAALALNCRVNPFSRFARKNYFYPDLPKAYQISQYELPLAGSGCLELFKDGEPARKVNIERLHLEEDAGKLLHDESHAFSHVDYNRCGVPLIEIVTNPDLRSPAETRLFLEALRRMLLYARVSDCKMEEGSLRCDANISLRPHGTKELGQKVEIKNMNSFKAVQRGLEYEVERQAAILNQGGRINQETRRWHEDKGVTSEMRTKEKDHDYRYFPEPDLPPLVVDAALLSKIRSNMPELPEFRYRRFTADYALSHYQAGIIISDPYLADFFEETTKLNNQPQKVANWLLGDVLKLLKQVDTDIETLPFKPSHLAELLMLIDGGKISGRTAKEVLEESFSAGKLPAEIVAEKGLGQISDTNELEQVVDDVLKKNSAAVRDHQEGKKNAFTFLVGSVMKATRGKANPVIVTALLQGKLDGSKQ
ncbi:MAG TPA: Asp-tRNA(Asn)/Glu-tRNA(Gln) amidotransferase GatCAB subunit B [Firmicutes bacterium]|nr:Asp-tRNA(Asn)/Glu-tRNA(Gln) amidotransferase GatCAB subunit B [Bacillota bacterium]